MRFTQKQLIDLVEKASTFDERFKGEFLPLDGDDGQNSVNNYRLEQWCQVSAQGDWDKFQNQLSWKGLTLNDARQLLGKVCIKDKEKLPKWTEDLNEIIHGTSVEKFLDKQTIEKKLFLNSQELIPFEEIFLSFIDIAKQKLMILSGSSYYLLSEEAHTKFERALLERLAQVCGLALAQEFSIFRSCHQSTIAYLLNQSSNLPSKKLYINFIKEMLEGKLLSFFQEYSVLAKLTTLITNFWIESTHKFISRLESDWSIIQTTFQPEVELNQVIDVQPKLSDFHDNGCSVTLIKFASGLKLVYKPKDLGLEKAYFNLLDWINKHNISLQFKLLKVISYSTHGWVEFVEYQVCQNQQQAKHYYRRSGMLSCLLYIMQGTDFHHGNLIASGEYPVLIDLETLMQPRMIKSQLPIKGAQYLAYYQFLNSVIGTGFMPRWEFGTGGESYDSSALGGVGEQETSFQILKWDNINTDKMTLSYQSAKTQAHQNIVFLNEKSLSPNDYIQEIKEGFYEMYCFFIKYQKVMEATESPLVHFANQSVRFVFRSTQMYASILQKTMQPTFLRYGIDRSIQLDILSIFMDFSDETVTKFIFLPLLEAEKISLEQLDIPLFRSNASSNNLIINNQEIVINCFQEPSYERVVFLLNKLNSKDLEQQISFIHGSLYSNSINHSYSFGEIQDVDCNIEKTYKLTSEIFVQQALLIKTELKERSICSDNGSITWIAPQYIVEAQQYQLQPLGFSLYDGCCGVALFLAALARITEDSESQNLALASLQDLRQMLQTPASAQIPETIGIGGASGCGSLIYALTKISHFLEDAAILEDAIRVESLITTEHIIADKKFDVVSGVAGTILGLINLYNFTHSSKVLDKLMICGHHLLNHTVNNNSDYKAWKTIESNNLLTGFSHGAAGIAYALLRLYELTNETSFLYTAIEAINYENSTFVLEFNNWPDFRRTKTDNELKFGYFWCHGAPGIGLARLGALKVYDNKRIRDDIAASIKTTKRYQLNNIDHLCCGNLGQVEFLFTAGQKLLKPELLEIATIQAMRVVTRAQQKGNFSYHPLLNYNPGFFQGASGIGYQLLRLAYPDQLPSVLLWE